MTAALLLVGVACVAFAIWWKPKPDEVHCQKFIAPLKHGGTLIATLKFYDDPDDVQRDLNRWAIRLENPKTDLYDAIERALSVKAISVSLDPPKAIQEAKKPTLKEKLITDFDEKHDAAQSLAKRFKEAPTLPDIIIGERPLNIHMEESLRTTIVKLFHDPDRQR